jgi:hypothetical protein
MEFTTDNGQVDKIETSSGVTLRVTPASIWFVDKAKQAARDKYDEPVAPKKLDDSGLEPVEIDDTNDKDYQKAVLETHIKRLQHIEQVYIAALTQPDGISRNKLVERYVEQLNAIRNSADFTGIELPDDDYTAVVMNCVLIDALDKRAVINAIERKLPLTEGELADGIAYFRHHIHRYGGRARRNNDASDSDTSGSTPTAKRKKQSGKTDV